MTTNEIIQGSCTELSSTIEGPVHMILTDPPFGVDYQSNRAVTPEGKAKNKIIENDADPVIAVQVFHDAIRPVVPHMADQCEIYVFTSWEVLDFWIPAMRDIAPGIIDLKMMLLWEKGYPGQGDLVANWGCGHEVILYAKKGRRPVGHRRSAILHFNPDEQTIDQEIESTEIRLAALRELKEGQRPGSASTGILTYDRVPSKQNIHPTEKPTNILEELIKMSSDPGDLVVDFFSGSGSTSVAAMNTGRNSIAFELDDDYIKNSRKRLEHTGFDF